MELKVLSLRYSSWSMRAWLALTAAGVKFKTTTVSLPHMKRQVASAGSGPIKVDMDSKELDARRALGSVKGFFPVLHVGESRVHESLAIAEYAADLGAGSGKPLWPSDPLVRALARSIVCEMATGFFNIRDELSCHLYGRLDLSKEGAIRDNTKKEIERVFEIWRECLEKKKDRGVAELGPYLFGAWSVCDCFYYPIITRFVTYNIKIPNDIKPYTDAVLSAPIVKQMLEISKKEPAIEIYDDAMKAKGGDPYATL